jgi:hypothetical protein
MAEGKTNGKPKIMASHAMNPKKVRQQGIHRELT